VVDLTPPTLTDNFLEAISTSSSTKDLSRNLISILQVDQEDRDFKSGDFILRAADPPSINQAFMTYFIGACFPSHSLPKNLETLKSTFNLYSLTPPPSSSDKDYLSHLRATNDNDTDFLLEQPEAKQAVVQRKCFIGGNQETLDDVLSTIGNIFYFAKSIVDFDINNTSSYPLILLRYSEFAEYIYDSEFKSLFQKHIPAMPWLPHSLISYIQQHFQDVTPIATKPKNLRSTLAGEPLPQGFPGFRAPLPAHHGHPSKLCYQRQHGYAV
jgi:hypothetical protein